MIANILGIAFILGWTFVVLRHFWHLHKKAKSSGAPVSCCGCSAAQNCHCSGNSCCHK